MRRCVLLCLVVPFFAARAKSAIVVPPEKARVEMFSVKSDPSEKAADCWRVLCDVDGDGSVDTLLCDGQNSWMVYLHKGDEWRYIGDVVFSPDCFNIEAVAGGVNIWTCQRIGGGEYYIGYYRIENGRLEKLPRRLLVAIPDGEESIAAKIYKAVFGGGAQLPFVLEKSETDARGSAVWKRVK